MKIRFIARKFTLTDDVKERVQKKLQKLDKFFPPFILDILKRHICSSLSFYLMYHFGQ